MSPRQLSRRAALILMGSGAAAAGAAGIGVWRLIDDGSGQAIESTADLAEPPNSVAGLTREDGLAYVGARYLAAVPEESSVERLAELTGLDPAAVPDERALEEELAEGRERIRDEFAQADTVQVDGWVLSPTEARLCALIALDA